MFDPKPGNLPGKKKKNPCSEKSPGSCSGWPSRWSNAAGRHASQKTSAGLEDVQRMPALLPRDTRHCSVCSCRALAGGCGGPAADKSLWAPAAWGFCGSDRFQKDECLIYEWLLCLAMHFCYGWASSTPQHGSAHRWAQPPSPSVTLETGPSWQLGKLWMLWLKGMYPE